VGLVVIRLCCGQHHGGPVCPDGLVMCCLCFSRFSESDLYVDQDGIRWDICTSCETSEQQARGRREHLDRIMDAELPRYAEALKRLGDS
jgi:hypothetical protein